MTLENFNNLFTKIITYNQDDWLDTVKERYETKLAWEINHLSAKMVIVGHLVRHWEKIVEYNSSVFLA